MGRQIIKQPNGRYLIFSTIVDNVTHYNMAPEDIIDLWVERERKQITEDVNKTISRLDKGEKPYHMFTQSYNETMDLIKEIHGVDDSEEIKNLIEK